MASITLTLTGNSSQLQTQYFPSIDLSDGNYVCGLIDFQTFNSIPNVDETNNLFYFGYKIMNNNDDNEIDLEFIDLKAQKTDKIAIIKQNNNEIKYTTIVPNDEIPKHRKKRAASIKTKQPLTCIKVPTGSYEVKVLK